MTSFPMINDNLDMINILSEMHINFEKSCKIIVNSLWINERNIRFSFQFQHMYSFRLIQNQFIGYLFLRFQHIISSIGR